MEMLYLGHSTARWYWEHAVAGARTAKRYPRRARLANCSHTASSVREMVRGTIFQDVPLDVMVPTKNVTPTQNVRFHMTSAPLPKGAFIQIAPQICIAAPELSFLQTARGASFGDALLYGYALCGTFALDNNAEGGRVDREKILTQAKLQSFVEKAQGLSGRKNALSVVRYVLENSNSPRESKCSMTLTLPFCRGGKGVAPAELNGRIPIPARYLPPDGRRSFRADLLWRAQKLTVEYQSDALHLTSEGSRSDCVKANTLLDMGFRQIGVSTAMLNSDAETEQVAQVLRRALGMRKQALPSGYEENVRELRQSLGLPI